MACIADGTTWDPRCGPVGHLWKEGKGDREPMWRRTYMNTQSNNTQHFWHWFKFLVHFRCGRVSIWYISSLIVAKADSVAKTHRVCEPIYTAGYYVYNYFLAGLLRYIIIHIIFGTLDPCYERAGIPFLAKIRYLRHCTGNTTLLWTSALCVPLYNSKYSSQLQRLYIACRTINHTS